VLRCMLVDTYMLIRIWHVGPSSSLAHQAVEFAGAFLVIVIFLNTVMEYCLGVC
jgi:hypothetical protein